MNFNNWYQTIYNNIKLKNQNNLVLTTFGPSGVLKEENIVRIGACSPDEFKSSARNNTAEIIMLDCEPNSNLNTLISTLKLHEPAVKENYRPHVIYAVSDKNNIILDQLLNVFRARDVATPVAVWYYFAHAFIALDWYREYKFYSEADLLSNKRFTYSYITMNRLVSGPRSYRLMLMSALEERGITNNALVSYTKFSEDSYPIPLRIKNRITQYCSITKRFDVDGEHIDNQSMHIDLSAHLSSFFNLVTETCFYEDFNHITEKVFRPIVMMQPFVLASTAGSLEYLKSYGFKTFDAWIDESYDKIKNPVKRSEALADVMQYICSLSEEQQRAMFDEMLPILLHNRRHFYNNLYDIVHKEMWGNYDTALQQVLPN
jgi:hypothetical protein